MAGRSWRLDSCAQRLRLNQLRARNPALRSKSLTAGSYHYLESRMGEIMSPGATRHTGPPRAWNLKRLALCYSLVVLHYSATAQSVRRADLPVKALNGHVPAVLAHLAAKGILPGTN